MTRHLHAALLAGVLAAASISVHSAEPTPPAVDLNIAAQPLGKALNEFGRQTGLQVVFFYGDIAQGMTSPPLKGSYTAQEALSRLLANTRLKYKYLNEKTVSIRSEEKGDNSSGRMPADQMRVAALEAQQSGQSANKSAESSAEASQGQMVVAGEREKRKPFEDGNLDIPRTIDDAQPYYIFDAKTIEQSGAANIEDFLRQRLTMNSVVTTNAANSGISTSGDLSTINLRGLGSDKTLILVDGRKMPDINITNVGYQADVNGISLAQIERIEVLPSSASGIYGGSAIGGVINIILKRDYVGGRANLRYDNVMDSDAPRRTASVNYGLALEGGRTRVALSASWADQSPLLLQDRLDVFQANLAQVLARSPNLLFSSGTPWLGNLPNIASASPLVLKAGNVPLNSNVTHVPAGTAPNTSITALGAALRANAGMWNMEFPEGNQPPTGRLRYLGRPSQTESASFNIRRQMLPWLELSAEGSRSVGTTSAPYNALTTPLGVSVNAPSNPFTTPVSVQVPDNRSTPVTTRSESRQMRVGALLNLPGNWTGLIDYSVAESSFGYTRINQDILARNADLASGALNPFVDNLLYPMGLDKYDSPISVSGAGGKNTSLTLRGSGMLPALPWGQPNLTVALEHLVYHKPRQDYLTQYSITRSNDNVATYYARNRVADSVYMETALPLIKKAWLPGVHALELQLSGRMEQYTNDGGTTSESYLINANPRVITYSPRTAVGGAYFVESRYERSNYTLGLRYQPIEDLTLRVSRSSAFLPPTPDQLTEDPSPVLTNRSVIDRRTGLPVTVAFFSGGNADLLPQDSTSAHAGVIWAPRSGPLAGLRLNVEYNWVQQFNAIGSRQIQDIVDNEASLPDRVTRNASGVITLVDITFMNLYMRESAGWDFSGDYSLKTDAGSFNLHVAASLFTRLITQNSLTSPRTDGVDAPNEGGTVKYRTNAQLSWENGRWGGSWSADYTPSYLQYGAIGGPRATQLNGVADTSYLIPQGGSRVSSQIYHDLFVSYRPDPQASASGPSSATAAKLLSGMTFQLGLRNVFDKVPPLDAYHNSNMYLSPYGDVRLRSYWLNVTREF